MSELSSADDDHPLKLTDGGGESVNSGVGMSFASLSVCISFQY